MGNQMKNRLTSGDGCHIFLMILAVLSFALFGGQPLTGGEIALTGAQFDSSDTTYELKHRAILIHFNNLEKFPTFTIRKKFDFSEYDYLIFKIRNLGVQKINLNIRLDNPGGDGQKNSLNDSYWLAPGETRDLRFELVKKGSKDDPLTIKGMRKGPPGVPATNGLELADIVRILLFVKHSEQLYKIELLGISGETHIPKVEAKNKFPLLDPFGQNKHENWPGKITSTSELENASLNEACYDAIPGRDQYGGWADGPKFTPTGYFRTGKYKNKWYLIDPEGNLFFSFGANCVGSASGTVITDRENYFESLPSREEFPQFYSKTSSIIGDFAGREVDVFLFENYNLYLKYGKNWEKRAVETAHKRIPGFGMNTIGNWSNLVYTKAGKTPYVVYTGLWGPNFVRIAGSKGYWGQFPDPFDENFAKIYERSVEKVNKYTSFINDPWCIGAFADNELSWGNEYDLALAALSSPPAQPARKAFQNMLFKKYPEIEALNQAWGTHFKSYAEMANLESIELKGEKSTALKEDLRDFTRLTAESYFSQIREVLRRLAPNQLYLGCRFAWVNPVVFHEALQYCDIVSFNIYERDLSQYKFPEEDIDKPVIIGEFHFGATDRGMWHPGLVKTDNQLERARLAQEYVITALKHPNIVGCHYFQYRDQSTTGRPLDGENYSIGLVSVADVPYPELTRALRETGEKMYDIRANSPAPEVPR